MSANGDGRTQSIGPPAGSLEELAAIMQPTGPVDEQGFYATRELEDGHWLAVEPLTFGRARLGRSGLHTLYGGGAAEAFEQGFADVFDYPSRELAIAAMLEWDGEGEPAGWTRHYATGRRRQPNGTIHVRHTDLVPGALEQLRAAVTAGAAHDCDEWILERRGVCALCDRPAGRELNPDAAALALEDAIRKRQK